MTPSIKSSRDAMKKSIAKGFGAVFIVLCLLASALTIGLPRGSSAASSTLTLNPDADTSIDQASPTKAAPTSRQLLAVGGSSVRQSFLRFTVGAIPAGTSIQSAKLRLLVTNDSTSGGVVSTMSNASWAEGITWNSRPIVDGKPLITLGAVAVNQIVEIDLTSVVKAGGAYSFAITGPSANTNTVGYASREYSGAADRPQLIVALQSGAATPPTATTVPAKPTATTAPTKPTTPPAQPTATTAPTQPTATTKPTTPPTQPTATTKPTTPPAQPTAVPPVPTPGVSTSAVMVQVGTGYLAGPELVQRNLLANQGVEPYKSALSDMLKFANSKLSSSPAPQQPLNIPDTSGPFVDDTATAYGLALAYQTTGDIKYAQKSRDFIMAWVQTTKTTTNTCPDNGSCQTSLIIGRAGPGFVFAAQLIQPSGAFSAADDAAFRAWLRTVILPTASERTNNWGDAGTFLRAAVTDYLGDTAGFNAAIAKWKSLVDLIATDGHIPEETRRDTSGINYTQEAIDYKIAVALIAQRRGIDIWSYGRFKLSVDYVAKYVLNPGAWPWASGAGANIHPMWEIAYQHWREPAYQPIITQERPYGSDGHSAVRWTTLTNGIPFK